MAEQQNREELKQRTKQAREKTREKFTEHGRQTKSEAARRAREYMERGRTRLRDQGQQVSRQQQDWLATELEHMAHAGYAAADRFEEEHEEWAGHLIESISEQCDKTADYLRHSEPNTIGEDLGRIVQRQPALTLGGMFVAGLAAARFLKASQRRHESDEELGFEDREAETSHTEADEDQDDRAWETSQPQAGTPTAPAQPAGKPPKAK